MARAKTVIQGTIKGEFQDVNVGDKVVVVTRGRGYTGVRQGTYMGYIEGVQYGQTHKRAVIDILSKRYVQIKPDGTEFDWRRDYNSATYNDVKATLTTREVEYVRRTVLKRNRIATIK